MKKTILEIISLFEPQIMPLFGQVKQLPQYGGLSTVYIAQPRDVSTFNKMKEIMLEIEPEAIIKTSGNIHVLNFSEDAKIVMIYAISQEQMDWFIDYHSYSSSIILGKIFKGSGLKYSEEGLEYIEYNQKINHRAPVGSIVISKDIDRILGVLGLSGETFKKGFSTLTEFFDFVIKSDYLRTDKFLSSDKEYKNFTFQEFDKYLTLTGFERTERREITVDELQVHFPEIDFATRIQELKDKSAAKKDIDEKFNGRVILEFVPEVTRETLGESICKFKFSFSSKGDYEDFIIQHSKEEIMEKFRETLTV